MTDVFNMKSLKSLALSTSVLALSTVSAVNAANAQEEEFKLEEIVVTAQKRAQSMQDVPVAVSAVTNRELEALGWQDPTDIAMQVPNMQVSAPLDPVQPVFIIRGVSMNDYNITQSSPIGVYSDEAYIGAVYLHGLSMFDLERLEVLRGPQGTLYGKNTTGGAINLVTRTPEIDDEANGYLTMGYGRFDEKSLSAAVEGTMVEGKLAVRAAVNYRKNDGFWENELGGPNLAQTKNHAGRVTFNFKPSDNFNAILKLQTAKSNPRGTPPRGVGRLPGGVNLIGQSNLDQQGTHGGASGHTGRSLSQTDGLNLKMQYDSDNFSVISVTSYYDGKYELNQDTDGVGADLVHFVWQAQTKSKAQDLRIQSNFDGDFNFIFGGYYGHEDVDSDVYAYVFGGLPFPAAQAYGRIHRIVDVEKKSLAAYFHGDWAVNDKVTVNLGLRYTSDKNTRDRFAMRHETAGGDFIGNWAPNFGPFGNAGIPAPFAPCSQLAIMSPPAHGAFCNPASPAFNALFHPAFGLVVYTDDKAGDPNAISAVRAETENEFTGKISVDYKTDAGHMVYGSYSRGFRAGAFNAGQVYFDVANEAGGYARPEFVDAYELGFKGEFLDNRLRFNATAFYYDYKDQQFVNQIGLSAVIENAKKASIKGIEAEILAAVSEGLTLQLGLGYLDTEYKEASLIDLGGGPVVDLAGNQLVGAPKLNVNFALDYETDISDDWVARFHLDGTYQSRQWYSAYNDFQSPVNPLVNYNNNKQKAYSIYNARLTLAEASEKYAFSFMVKNLFDKNYDVSSVNINAGLGYDMYLEGPPRTYGIEFTTRF